MAGDQEAKVELFDHPWGMTVVVPLDEAAATSTCADLAPDSDWVCEEHGRQGVVGCMGPWRPAEVSDG